jgi:hypothetical protein
MPGLSLKTAAQAFHGDRFYGWDATTDTFTRPFYGRLFIADRFKTIYNRPTRRQKLTMPEGVRLPASYVIRRQQDSEVFLLSTLVEKEYWKGVEHYDSIGTVHRAMPDTGGAATHHAYGTTGSGAALGTVGVTASTKVYVDLEMRTTESEDLTEKLKTGHYVCYHSVNVEFTPGDYLEFDGKHYRVEVETFDSGFGFSRLVQEDPCYTNGVYYYEGSATVAYNPATGVASSSGAVSTPFSFIPGFMVDSFDSSSQSYDNDSTIYVYARHLGFTPKAEDRVEIGGKTLRVKRVEHSALQLQWKLEVGS